MLRILCVLIVVVGSSPAWGEVVGRTVEYGTESTDMQGFLAYDDQISGPRPGVLVVHEWWGLNDYARERARQLAELGYTALAVDMYGDGKQARHPDEASEFANAVNSHWQEARARFDAALELLKSQDTTDPSHIAAIGYCFGGGVVLNMARAGVDLDGVVSFHGTLSTEHPAQPGQVKARVLVLHGAEDPFVTDEQVARFKSEMENAGVDYRFIAYAGAKHSFTNPDADRYGKRFDLPLAYSAEADRKSWQEMRSFFDRIFSQ